ncbi:MAG: hypothetical protein J0G33_08840 [Afipia felis]|nr:hypothetical protein [Afipia felis]
MAYSNDRLDRFADTGAVISADSTDSLKIRWGIALEHQSAGKAVEPHLRDR